MLYRMTPILLVSLDECVLDIYHHDLGPETKLGRSWPGGTEEIIIAAP